LDEAPCRRCRAADQPLEAAPLPGEVGELVRASTCRACWDSWRGEQVRLINELKLSPANPQHYAFLVERMKVFLSLP
jgi:Fe-S cluster biosynthesis and repair protein YggX